MALTREFLEMQEHYEKLIATKDQTIEGLLEISKCLGQTCNNDVKEIERLRDNIAKRHKEEVEWLQQMDSLFECGKEYEDIWKYLTDRLNELYIKEKYNGK